MTTPSPAPAPTTVASPVVGVATTAAWALPLAALLVLGLSDRVTWLLPASRPQSHSFLTLASAVGAVGVAVGIAALRTRLEAPARRRVVAGTAASGSMLLVVVVAAIAGSVSGKQTEAELKAATDSALASAPGWNGGAMIDGAGVFAFEIDGSTALAKLLLRPYDTPYRAMLFGVDNRGRDRESVLELEGARVGHASGAITVAALAVAPVRVPARERLDGVPVFFAPAESWLDVAWIEVRLDGVARRIPGRYFTLEQKRAIDAARAGRPGR
jgi:hypothetical protein